MTVAVFKPAAAMFINMHVTEKGISYQSSLSEEGLLTTAWKFEYKDKQHLATRSRPLPPQL